MDSRSQAEIIRVERLIRRHIQSAVDQRRVEPFDAGKSLSELIEKGHPNVAVARRVGAQMQAEKRFGFISHSEQLSCAY